MTIPFFTETEITLISRSRSEAVKSVYTVQKATIQVLEAFILTGSFTARFRRKAQARSIKNFGLLSAVWTVSKTTQ